MISAILFCFSVVAAGQFQIASTLQQASRRRP